MADLLNLARQQTTTTGSDPIILGPVVNGFISWDAAGAVDGQEYTYGIEQGNEREIGRGVYTSATQELTRNVLRSTNNNQPIFLDGTAQVVCTPAAEDFFSQRVYSTKAALEAERVPINSDLIILQGYTTVGDGGGASYKRVGTEPTHPGKIQDVSGAWWEIASVTLVPEMFGVDGVDDGIAFQRASDVAKALKRKIIGQGEYLLASAVDFTEAVVDFSAATIKLADNFSPSVAITLGQPDGDATTTLGRYSADFYIDGNKANQTGTPIAVLIEDLITPSNRFVIRGADCNTLCKIQGAVEYVSVDIHADRCDLACLVVEKTVDPLGDFTPDDILVNIYGHECNSYFRCEGTTHITAKINIFCEQGGLAGDRAIELVPTLGEFTIAGILRAYQGDAGVYADMSDSRSLVMLDNLQIDSGSSLHNIHVLNAGVVAGTVSLRAHNRVWLEAVQAVNLSISTNGSQSGELIKLGNTPDARPLGCGLLRLVCMDMLAATKPLRVLNLNSGVGDLDGNTRGLIIDLQTDGTGDIAQILHSEGLTLNQANCSVSWLNQVTFDAFKKDTMGMAGTVEVLDDSFIAFTPPHRAHRIMVRERNRPEYFIGFARVDGPSAIATMTEFQSSALYDGTTGALTGTTGVDGNVTISAHTDGKFYIENRRGTSIRFWIVID